ncbi:NAD(+) diphosphatase [Frigidibacter sp. MR17.24]|uniref:NAD(+) diphosphatase n=1 Tax=Frigidibacter sp. MR17.24 TaxID=3127345 RepID=UPI003012FB37
MMITGGGRDTELADLAFAGGGLDRAAWLRADPAELAQRQADARVLPLWRGKVLLSAPADPGARALGLVAPDDAMLAGHALMFLGLAPDGRAMFCADISDWEPGPEQPAMPGSFFDPTEQWHPEAPEGCRFGELRGTMTELAAFDAELAATARALVTWHGGHGFCSACGAASEIAQAGWTRICPACGRHHFPRTDPVVIMLVTRGNSLLLGRSPAWPEGMYSCLAGFMEPGETFEAAVRREVAEETGVVVGAVAYVASQPWPFPASLMLGARAEALSEAITIDPVEIEDARWATREELAEVFAGRHPVIRAPRRGAIAGYLMRQWLADRLE